MRKKIRTKRPPPIHVMLEFCCIHCVNDTRQRRSKQKDRTDCCLRLCDLGKLHDTAALGACAVEQDFSELHLSCRLEQLHQVLIRRRPWELRRPPFVSGVDTSGKETTAHIPHHDLLARFFLVRGPACPCPAPESPTVAAR